jgi:hypothetical protein
MAVAAISMVHNEQDVIGYVVRHMLAECDLVLVADNESTDATREILEAIDDPRLLIFDEPCEDFAQVRVLMRLTREAEVRHASWIVPFDADEWWYCPTGLRIADVLDAFPSVVHATRAEALDMVPQPSDPAGEPDPFARLRWARPATAASPENRKIAFRPGGLRRLTQGCHALQGEPFPPFGPLRIKHVPYRSFEQAKAKLRHGRSALAQSNEPPGSGWHWREWGALSEDGLREWWRVWTNPAGLVRWTP